MTDEYEEVPGASEIERQLRATEFAWRLIAAMFDPGDPDPPWTQPPSDERNASLQSKTTRVVLSEAMAAGVTPLDLIGAELEILRVYLYDDAKRELARTAHDRFLASQHPDSDGPGLDAEDHRRSDGTPLL